MILIMMVSLSTYAQYPTTKKIKGRELVIMTLPQAEEIDKKFVKLKDSINWLNSQLKNSNLKIQELKIDTFKNIQPYTQYNLIEHLNRYELEMYRRFEVERYRMLDYENKETSRKITIWFTTAAIALIVYFVTALNKLD